MMHKRRPLVCANWKLNHLLSKTLDVLGEVKDHCSPLESVDLVVAPVATVLQAACNITKGSPIKIAAQNLFYESSGAFTGEWSAQHVLELGCRFAIVGHSERRQYFNETDETVSKKVQSCLGHGIVPIACVGESIDERNAGLVENVLLRQVNSILSGVSHEQAPNLVIAYEPIWAIGTGLTATPDQAQEAHKFIRSILNDRFSNAVGEKMRILYGGSVKPDNARSLAAQTDIDGALVGGASLAARSFLDIALGFANLIS